MTLDSEDMEMPDIETHIFWQPTWKQYKKGKPLLPTQIKRFEAKHPELTPIYWSETARPLNEYFTQKGVSIMYLRGESDE